jgi:hypothetical protein
MPASASEGPPGETHYPFFARAAARAQTGMNGGHRLASRISPTGKALSIRLLWGVTFPGPP